MPSLVVLIILAVAIITPSVGWWQSSIRLRVCKAESQAFEDKTRLAGEKSEKDRVKAETALAKAAVRIQEKLNETAAERDKRFDDYKRLLAASQGGHTGGSKDGEVSPSAPRLACPDGGAELNTAMAGFEDAVLEEILKSRDAAISRSIACKAYIEQITEIINKESYHAVQP